MANSGKSTSRKSPAKRPAKSSKPAPGTARVLSSTLLHSSKVFTLHHDEIVEPSGLRVSREVIRHPGSVVILALDERKDEPSVLLIRQYRYAANRELWELPAGRIDEGEEPLAAAQRELIEETGYQASEWKLALRYYASPGFLDEVMNVYAARDLRKGKARPEEDERITPRMVPLKRALDWVMQGKIEDAKAIAGILWAAQKFQFLASRR